MPVLFIGQRESPRFFAERAEYYFGLSGLNALIGFATRGDALRACPWLLYVAPSALRFVSRLPSALYFALLARCDSFRACRGLSYSARSALLKRVNIDQVEFHENVFFFIGIALDAHAILINRFAELACKVTFFR